MTVMGSSLFNNMDEAIAKFIETSNEITEDTSTIMYYQSHRGRNRGRGSYRGCIFRLILRLIYFFDSVFTYLTI